MAKLFNTILLSTVLVCCNNSYTYDIEYSPLYDYKGTFLSKCEVEGTGQLYYKKRGTEDKKYLVDENNRPYYDLETVLKTLEINSSKDTDLNDPRESDYDENFQEEKKGWNTLIIPKGVTLTNNPVVNNDNTKNGGLVFNDCSNSSVLILGTLQAPTVENGKSPITIDGFVAGRGDFKIILAPDSNYLQVNDIPKEDADLSTYYPCPINKIDRQGDPKFLLYPGCSGNFIIENNYNKSDAIGLKGTIYLNRFDKTPNESKDNALVKITASPEVHMVLPINSCEEYYKLTKYTGDVKNENTYYVTNYFPGCYWNIRENKIIPYFQGSGHGEYSFEGVNKPLAFNISEDGTKSVLGLNSDNEFAKYDAKLWKECKFNNDKYGFKAYNIKANKGNYFNTDDAYKLFYDVDYNKRFPLLLNSDSIYLGLLGSRDIVLKTNSNTITIYGDNTNYNGQLRLPHQVNRILYFNDNSVIKNIAKYNEEGRIDKTSFDFDINIIHTNSYSNPSKMEKVDNQIIWDLSKKGNKLHLDFSKYKPWEPVLVTVINTSKNRKIADTIIVSVYNNNHIYKHNDTKNINGLIVTPPEIKNVIFNDYSFIRTININDKALNYKFESENFFRPFEVYDKVSETKQGYINPKYLTDNAKQEDGKEKTHPHHWKDREESQKPSTNNEDDQQPLDNNADENNIVPYNGDNNGSIIDPRIRGINIFIEKLNIEPNSNLTVCLPPHNSLFCIGPNKMMRLNNRLNDK